MLMDAARTVRPVSPLGEFVRSRVEQVLARWEGGEAPDASPVRKAAVRRLLDAIDDLGAAVDEILADGSSPSEQPAGRRVLLVGEPSPIEAELGQLLMPTAAVETVATLDQALQNAIARSPDVVVGWGGGSVAGVRALRETHPGLPVVVAATNPAETASLAAAFAADPVILLGSDVRAVEIAIAVRALLELHPREERSIPGDLALPDITDEPRSYPHLAGLLPRALERAIDFDVGAGIVARPGAEPLVDVYARSDCSDETLQRVREHALALYRLIAGGAGRVPDASTFAPPLPLRSALHVPLATDNRIVGLTYLASFRPDAFAAGDEDVLAALATRASAGYRKLEQSLSRLRVTPRQSQVLALVAAGLSDKEVASRLGLSHRTVRTHLDRLLREHGFRSRTEAVAAWLRAQQG
ncbi:MAG: LuxR C-terminal-related transcriptional regulator [Myxococcales bacterium]